MKKILVSGCLYGWNCRYDGKSAKCEDEIFSEWREKGMLVPVCPEMDGGLDAPRKPCEIVGDKVLSKDGEDFTEQYKKGAEAALARAIECGAELCILKDNSPSCGSMFVYDGSFSGKKDFGRGFAAELLKEYGLPVYSENELQLANSYLKLLERRDKNKDKK